MKGFEINLDTIGLTEVKLIGDIAPDELGDLECRNVRLEINYGRRNLALTANSSADIAFLKELLISEYEIYKATRPVVEAI